MTTGSSGTDYPLARTLDGHRARVALLEELWDRGAVSRLAALGVGPGWRCLEVGAGGGSIARWLCEVVGAGGRVAAVDLDTRLLEENPPPNLEIHRRDVVTDGLPGDGYDLVHARCLLMHLRERHRSLADMVASVRPGGRILLEEADFSPVTSAGSLSYREVWEKALVVTAEAGGDWRWAARLPAHLTAAGAVDVSATAELGDFSGASPRARLIALTFEQLAPRLIEVGIAPERIAEATAQLADPAQSFSGPVSMRADGRRPGSGI